MLEAAEKTVSRSFLCLGFVVSQSVMLFERLLFAEQNALSCGGYVAVYVVVYVWF